MRVGWKPESFEPQEKNFFCCDTPETLVSRWNLTKKGASTFGWKTGLSSGARLGDETQS